MFLEQLHFFARVHSASVTECPLSCFHLRGVNMTMISGLVLIRQYRVCWAVWCAIVLGFIASPLLTAVQMQEGDYMVLLEKLMRYVMVSSL